MKRILCGTILLAISIYSGAQDTLHRRLNIVAAYTPGLQFFRLNGVENFNYYNIIKNMPANGFIINPNYTPTFLHTIYVNASIFGNKSYYLEFNGTWGKNKITGYGYSTDASGNPVQTTVITTYATSFIGIGLKKEFVFEKWGTCYAGISFQNSIMDDYTATSSIQIKDRTTGDIISHENGRGGSSAYMLQRLGVLSIFDNPKIILEYKYKFFSHLYFTASYSYWRCNAIVNDLYGLSKRYLIKFRNSNHYRPNKTLEYGNDLYSHNLSIGLSLSLQK